MKNLLAAILVATTFIGTIEAVEKKPIKEVDTDSFTSDTQVTPKGAGDNHVSIVWWIPTEFWEAILSRDATTGEADKKATLDAMAGVSLLAVVQAEVTPFGAFKFYSKEEIDKNMTVSFIDSEGKKHNVSQVKEIAPDLEVVLGVFKPILGAAMGNLGNNMHFYVLNDKTKTASRLLDPYGKGKIDIHLAKRDETPLAAVVELPVNALFVPRKCPNGKEAHVSWSFCPWTGKPLD